jgi:GNAT superfamily N-acetyltransferase
MTIRYGWRDPFSNAEVDALHGEAFEHPVIGDDWVGQVEGHSLGWVCAWDGQELVGFVNIAWDGGVHAFILDTMVSAKEQRRGIGTRLVAIAVERVRAAGCQWLHVDFEEDLSAFYFEACGFDPTNAGVIRLT